MRNKILKTIFTIIIGVILFARVDAVSLAMAGDNVIQEGEYNSIRFLAGNNATNKARIDGLSFIAGRNVVAEGTVSYGFYAGQFVTINEYVEKDAFAAGSVITVGKNAYIGRDLYAAAETIVVENDINRDARLAASRIELKDITINGDAFLEADEIIFDSNTKITGKLKYNEDTKVTGLVETNMGSIEKTKRVEVTVEETTIFDRITSIIMSMAAAIITMIVLFFIAPFVKTKLDKEKLEGNIIVKTAAKGFGFLVLIPFILIFTIFTGVLTPLSLIVLCLYIICIYMSSLVSSYIVGKLLLKKIFSKDNQYLAIVLGIVVVKTVVLIPLIGGLVGFVASTYGFGIIITVPQPDSIS